MHPRLAMIETQVVQFGLKMVAELRERNRKPWRGMVLEMMRRLPLGKVGFHVLYFIIANSDFTNNHADLT